MNALWLLVPGVWVAVASGGLQWALRRHREERRPWLDLLSRSVDTAADAPGLAAIDGVATGRDDSVGTIPAPFTGRPCLGYVIEIITEEHFLNTVTWERAWQDGGGSFAIVTADGRPRATVDLDGGQNIFPVPLEAHTKLSSVTAETVFQGTMDRVPPLIATFSQRLPLEVQHLLWRPSQQMVGGKRVYFNERIVVPGQSVVVAGPHDPGPAGPRFATSYDQSVSLGLGTIASERARVAKLPIASEASGAVLGGALAAAAVGAIVGITSG